MESPTASNNNSIGSPNSHSRAALQLGSSYAASSSTLNSPSNFSFSAPTSKFQDSGAFSKGSLASLCYQYICSNFVVIFRAPQKHLLPLELRKKFWRYGLRGKLIDDTVIHAFVDSVNDEIDLSGSNITDLTLQNCAENTEILTHLKSIRLDWCQYVTCKGVDMLCKRATSLTSLTFNFTAIPDAVVISVCTNLTYRLNCLEVAGCRNLSPGVLDWIAEYAPNLRVLDISFCKKLSPLTSNIAMPSFTSSWVLGRLTNLECLVATNLCDGSEECNATALKALARLQNLHILNLSQFRVLNDEHLSSILMELPNLTVLDISWCATLTKEKPAWLKCISSLHRLSLQGLNVSDALLSDLSMLTPKLQSLDISWCKGISIEGLQVFLSKLPTLAELNVCNCKALSLAAMKQLLLKYPSLAIIASDSSEKV